MGIHINNFLQTINPRLLSLLLVWSIIWKGWALWRAARLKDTGWYIFLLIFNLLGIPEIIYIVATNKRYKDLSQRVR